MTRALRSSWTLLGLVLVLVAACNPAVPAPGAAPAPAPGAGGAASAPAAPQPGQAAPAKLLLGKTGSGAELQFWPVYVAKGQGYFAQEGLEVEETTVGAAFTLTQALIAGDAQLVGFTVLSMAAAIGAGAPLKMVAATQDLPSIRVIARPEINAWADLKGKVISSGNTNGDYFDVVMRMVLAANGLNEGDYTMRTMPGAARVPALEAGQVAAALLSDYDSQIMLRAGYKSFGFVQDYVKDIQYGGYLVDGAWARANEDVLVRYLRALLRSTAWLFDPKNKEEASRLFNERGPELTPDQVDILYDQAVTRQFLSRTLRPNMKGIETILAIAHEQGALPEIPPLDNWVDMSYLDKASR